ncbi:uncharacterized protein LOC125178945 [Hyalella azteca]|uniref:Uncharacterized protein LOC125178945 n=1 Tax=Hyalella azteca TaxID=294128 RepID=A0A979FTW4_HYAAZ|nr:uncharacterized protein LOC125178945 [Hyalella azteca]
MLAGSSLISDLNRINSLLINCTNTVQDINSERFTVKREMKAFLTSPDKSEALNSSGQEAESQIDTFISVDENKDKQKTVGLLETETPKSSSSVAHPSLKIDNEDLDEIQWSHKQNSRKDDENSCSEKNPDENDTKFMCSLKDSVQTIPSDEAPAYARQTTVSVPKSILKTRHSSPTATPPVRKFAQYLREKNSVAQNDDPSSVVTYRKKVKFDLSPQHDLGDEDNKFTGSQHDVYFVSEDGVRNKGLAYAASPYSDHNQLYNHMQDDGVINTTSHQEYSDYYEISLQNDDDILKVSMNENSYFEDNTADRQGIDQSNKNQGAAVSTALCEVPTSQVSSTTGLLQISPTGVRPDRAVGQEVADKWSTLDSGDRQARHEVVHRRNLAFVCTTNEHFDSTQQTAMQQENTMQFSAINAEGFTEQEKIEDEVIYADDEKSRSVHDHEQDSGDDIFSGPVEGQADNNSKETMETFCADKGLTSPPHFHVRRTSASTIENKSPDMETPIHFANIVEIVHSDVVRTSYEQDDDSEVTRLIVSESSETPAPVQSLIASEIRENDNDQDRIEEQKNDGALDDCTSDIIEFEKLDKVSNHSDDEEEYDDDDGTMIVRDEDENEKFNSHRPSTSSSIHKADCNEAPTKPTPLFPEGNTQPVSDSNDHIDNEGIKGPAGRLDAKGVGFNPLQSLDLSRLQSERGVYSRMFLRQFKGGIYKKKQLSSLPAEVEVKGSDHTSSSPSDAHQSSRSLINEAKSLPASCTSQVKEPHDKLLSHHQPPHTYALASESDLNIQPSKATPAGHKQPHPDTSSGHQELLQKMDRMSSAIDELISTYPRYPKNGL